MKNTLFDADTPSVNETSFINLPEGWGDYDITKASLSRSEGKPDLYAQFTFKNEKGTFTQPLYMGRSDDQSLSEKEVTKRRIAAGVLKELWNVSELKGDANFDRLPNFVGKRVRLRVEHREWEGKTFADIKEVRKPESASPPSRYHQPEDDDDKIDMGEKGPGTPVTSDPEPAVAEPAKKPTRWKKSA